MPEPPRDPGAYGAAMVFGGSMNVGDTVHHPWLEAEKRILAELVEARTPLLGMCLGCQLVAEAAGGDVARASEPEIGWSGVELTPEGREDRLLGSLPGEFDAFQWHSYACSPPPGSTVLATSPVCLQAFRTEAAWGIQFHAEVSAGDAERWIDDYRSDEDAVAIGLDQEALRRETASRIDAWNGLGRALCGRFLDFAYSGSSEIGVT